MAIEYLRSSRSEAIIGLRLKVLVSIVGKAAPTDISLIEVINFDDWEDREFPVQQRKKPRSDK